MSNVNQLFYQNNKTSGDIWRQVVPCTLIFLAACWVLFADLGKYPLFNPDEGLFAEPAREILDTGEWMTSLLNYVVRYTKPPLVMWAMALSYHAFGVNEFAARFVGASCGALLVAVTYCFLARYTGVKAAALGSLTLISAPLYIGTARMAITDMPLSFLFVSNLMCFYRAFAEKSGFFCYLGYVLLGFAVMTKGPVAILLAVLILFAYHWLKGELRQAWHFYKPWWGALLVSAIALPWFVSEIVITKGAYFQAFFLRENLQRFSSVVDSHKGGWWYQVLAMMVGYLPWSAFVPQSLFKSFLYWKSSIYQENKVTSFFQSFRNLSRTQDISLFATLWLVIILIFFSVSVSKLMTYTLPAFPAMAILVGIEIAAALEQKAIVRLLLPLALLAIIYGAAGLSAPIVLAKLRDCPVELIQILNNYTSVESIIILICLALIFLRRFNIAIATFTILTILAMANCERKILPVISQRWEGALPDYARYAASTPYPILLFDFRKPGIPFYTQRQVIQPTSRQALVLRLLGFDQAYILTKVADRQFFAHLPGYRIVLDDGHFMLVVWRKPANVISHKNNGRQYADLSLAN